MDVLQQLQSNITATCPLAFGGTSGSLFAGAVAAVVAAHCAIFEDYSWPKDRAYEILTSTEEASYDVIIVGAGTAGSLIAGRLAQLHPSWSVLLVEAGGDPGLDSEVPAFLFKNQNTDVDWQYKTNPDGKSCLGYQNNSCKWSKGKALGGSSSINAMLYVRGHPKDYDDWENDGNAGWGYKHLLPYSEKLEHGLGLSESELNDNPMYDVIEKAWRELGFLTYAQDTDDNYVGIRVTKLLIKGGKRLNSAKVFLKEYKNLHIMKNTLVGKILIDKGLKIAKGIEVKHNNGVVMQIPVRKEVILSAGSVATPQLLMLSGIGPKAHLNEKNIDCLLDLPVGQNLQDHVLLPLFLKTNIKYQLSPPMMLQFLIQYMLAKTGPLGQLGILDLMGFIDTKNNSYPDIQFHHTYYNIKDEFALTPYLESIGVRKSIITLITELNEESDILGIFPTLIHPKSKGEILLTDDKPNSKPVINARYFQNNEDMKTLLRAIHFIYKLETTESFKSFGIELYELPIPECTTFPGKSDEYWECYIRHMGTTTYHPVGTAKMGPRSDATAVVDDTLLVHGVKGLRVVDASVMPKITGGNTMAPTLVIAMKAVDMVMKTYSEVIKEEL